MDILLKSKLFGERGQTSPENEPQSVPYLGPACVLRLQGGAGSPGCWFKWIVLGSGLPLFQNQPSKQAFPLSDSLPAPQNLLFPAWDLGWPGLAEEEGRDLCFGVTLETLKVCGFVLGPQGADWRKVGGGAQQEAFSTPTPQVYIWSSLSALGRPGQQGSG